MERNKRGASILFVMAALVVTGFISIALLKMITSDQQSEILYSSSESARLAAHAGIVSAISRLTTSDADSVDTILSLLNFYADAYDPDTIQNVDKYIWLRGGKNSWEQLSQDQKFRVRIDAFHPDSFEISLVSEGVGRGNSKATAVAVVDLKDIERDYNSVPYATPTNAIQMDNGAFEFNTNLVVYGNTSLKGGMTVNGGSATFHGRFRLDSISDGTNNTVDEVVLNSQPVEIDSNAYFAGKCSTTVTTTFNSSAGFDGVFAFMSGSRFQFLGDTLYLNRGARNGLYAKADMKGNALKAYENGSNIFYREGAGSAQRFVNHVFDDTKYTGGAVGDEISIKEALGFPNEPDPEIEFNTSVLNVNKTVDARTTPYITADTLNNWYYNVYSGSLQDDKFLIVRVKYTTSAYGIFKKDASKFSGKAIIWLDDGRNLGGDFVETTSGANLTVYCATNSTNENRFGSSPYVRGFFYLDNAPNQFVFMHNGTIKGAVYATPNAKLKFDKPAGSGSTTTIRYDPEIIRELDSLGVFSPAGSSSSEDNVPITLKPGKTRISAEVLGQAI
jgi:hypothetical protein